MARTNVIYACAGAALFGAGVASVASAQEVAPGDGLEEIIVTAQKRAEPLQSVPVAVSAFSAAALQNSNTSDVTGLQGLVPGMTITRSGASLNTPQMSLRGISIQDVEKSVESGIGVTLDGVPLATSTGVLLQAFDVERIEVLRGPQGLLFGKNTTGGTINVIRSRPNPDGPATGKARITVGSFGRNDYEAVVSAPLIPGKLAIKGAMTLNFNNGEYKNRLTGKRQGDRRFHDYIVSLNATPTDQLSLLLTYERMEDDSDIPPYVHLLTPELIQLGVPGYVGGANGPCFNPAMSIICAGGVDKDNNQVEMPVQPAFYNLDAVTFEGALDLDSVKLVSVFGYRRSKEDQDSNFDATRFVLFSVQRPQTYRQISEELRVETNFDGPLNFVAGGFYFKNKYNIFQHVSLDFAAISASAPGGFFLNSLNSYDVTISSRSAALFFQGEYEVTDQIKLIFGGRQTWDRKKIHFRQFAPVPGPVRDKDVLGPLIGDRHDAASFKKFTPKLGVEFKPSQDVLAYASYSRGYNTGGFNGRAPNQNLLGPFQPETLDAFEIGLKTEWWNDRLRFNVAAFHNTMKNKQEDLLVITDSGANGTTTVNAAKARYKGVEVELAAAPVRGWTITSSLGYLDAKYVNFIGNLGQGLADLSGLKLRRTPKWTAGLVSDYVFDVGPGTLGMNAAVYHVSRYETNVLNDPRGSIAPTTKVDLGLRYTFPAGDGLDLEVAGFVKNLTDETQISGSSSGNSRGTFVEFGIPTVGRTWGASLMAKF